MVHCVGLDFDRCYQYQYPVRNFESIILLIKAVQSYIANIILAISIIFKTVLLLDKEHV